MAIATLAATSKQHDETSSRPECGQHDVEDARPGGGHAARVMPWWDAAARCTRSLSYCDAAHAHNSVSLVASTCARRPNRPGNFSYVSVAPWSRLVFLESRDIDAVSRQAAQKGAAIGSSVRLASEAACPQFGSYSHTTRPDATPGLNSLNRSPTSTSHTTHAVSHPSPVRHRSLHRIVHRCEGVV